MGNLGSTNHLFGKISCGSIVKELFGEQRANLLPPFWARGHNLTKMCVYAHPQSQMGNFLWGIFISLQAGSCILKYELAKKLMCWSVCSRFIGDGVGKSMENSKQSACDDLQQVDVSCRPKLRPLPLPRQSSSRNKRRKKTSAPLPPTSSDENVFARPPAISSLLQGRRGFFLKTEFYQQSGLSIFYELLCFRKLLNVE